MINFNGVGVALVTPFLQSGDVDYASLTKLVNHTIENGVDYLVVLGTTAETATLSEDEKERVIHHILTVNNNRLPIVLGIGGNDTVKVVNQIRSAKFDGISAILSVTPYYNKPNQEGIFAHYAEIAKCSPLPIILYNVPGRTGVNMSAETTLKLAHKFSNIVAIKEASCNLAQVAYILRDRPNGFAVISGDDNSTLPIIALGGNGVISVSANAYTKTFCEMVHTCLKGDFKTASELNFKLIEATDMLFAEGNPTGVKAALEIKGIAKSYLRLPLVKASNALYENIKGQISKFNL